MVLLETNNYLLNKYFDANKFTFGNSKTLKLGTETGKFHEQHRS